jgi:hypothetical protein
MKTDYTREELLKLCEAALVPQHRWHDRDSASAQEGVGKCYAFLRDGCDFKVCTHKDNDVYPATDNLTVWVVVKVHGFNYFEDGEVSEELFYIPTQERLDKRRGGDWY